MQSDIKEISFKKQLEIEVKEMERLRSFVFFSGYFTMEEVREYDKYIKEQKEVISYIK